MSYAEFEYYGHIIAVFRGREVIYLGKVEGSLKPLDDGLAANFVANIYCLVRTTRELALYRGFETSRKTITAAGEKPAEKIGRWWTPYRPTLLIESLGLPSYLRQEYRYKTATAIQYLNTEGKINKGNRIDMVVRKILKRNSNLFIGRAAGQLEAFRGITRKLSGGAVQVYFPDLEYAKKQLYGEKIWEVH